MITDEDARWFLQQQGMRLEWNLDPPRPWEGGAGDADEGCEIPPPPLDYVTFTRLLLEAAEEAGLSSSGKIGWDVQDSDSERREKLFAFQERVRRFVPRPTNRSDLVGPRRRHQRGVLRRMWWWPDEWPQYLCQLDRDYIDPWRKAWLYGRSEGSEERALHYLTIWAVKLMRIRLADGEQPDVTSVHAGAVVSRLLGISYMSWLQEEIRSETGVSLALVTWSRWVRGDGPSYILGGVGIACLCAAVWGAVRHYYSGWWLLAIVPALLAVMLLCLSWLLSPGSTNWLAWRVDRKSTFGDLTREIVERNRREWELLQQEYGVHHEEVAAVSRTRPGGVAQQHLGRRVDAGAGGAGTEGHEGGGNGE